MNALKANEDRGECYGRNCEEGRKCFKLRYKLVTDAATHPSAAEHRPAASAEARASLAHGTSDYDNSVLRVA